MLDPARSGDRDADENGEHHDIVPLDPVEHAVRKPARDGPTDVAMHLLVPQRIRPDMSQERLDLCKKLTSQSGLPAGDRSSPGAG